MSDEDLLLMKEDISEIKTALIGNKYNKEQSIVNRLGEVEDKQSRYEKRELKAMGFLFGVSFIITLIYNVFTDLFKK